MNKSSRVILRGIACCCVLWSISLPAHAQQLPENYQNLKLYELDRACDALAANGFTAANRADAFVAWMAAKEWRSLDINSLYNLYQWVSPDALNPQRFSARWNGLLTAPATGAYTLRQVPVYKGANCRLKVVIDGQIVLDSTQKSSDGSSFVTRPVQLVAGEAVPIQVDLVHQASRIAPIYDFSESAPMAVLTWKLGQAAEAIIPTAAYTPPQEFAEAGVHGLKGQYFGNLEFGDLRSTRLDPALDMVWSWPPVAPVHQEEASAVLAACKTKLLNGQFLSQSAAGRTKIIHYHMWRIAYHLTAAERRQLVEILRGQPEILRVITPAIMGRMMQAIYMLPGDEHIDLLGEWALARPQPHSRAGVYPGYGEGHYQALNTDFYWLMGRFMQGPYAPDAETLCDKYLERPDGTCNLAVAYAAAYASRLNGTPGKFIHRLDERINDRSVSGDKLVTWLIARAFATGAVPGRLEPLAGYSDLESAFVAAENKDQKLWVLEEIVARLSSVNKGAKAKALIEEHRGEFTTQSQQQAMAQWTKKADELATTYTNQLAAQKVAAKTAYSKELERRRKAATDRGDQAAAARFAELLSAAQTNQQ